MKPMQPGYKEWPKKEKKPPEPKKEEKII